eukprot:356454-Chlamydomonas_euryale.AAC.8
MAGWMSWPMGAATTPDVASAQGDGHSGPTDGPDTGVTNVARASGPCSDTESQGATGSGSNCARQCEASKQSSGPWADNSGSNKAVRHLPAR